jgi:DNA-binding NtrC family response regulator
VTEQPQLLLVDDDKSTLRALPETLRFRLPEIHVDICESAEKALRCVQATDYFAVITDMTLPGMNGMRLVQALSRELPLSPVLCITGHVDQALAAQAVRAGAYDFISKPIDRDQLVLSVMRALECHTFRVHFERHNALVTRLHQHLRQIEQVWKPFFLSKLEATRDLGDERIDQSRTLMLKAVTICESQAKLFTDRLDFAERHHQWAQENLRRPHR